MYTGGVSAPAFERTMQLLEAQVGRPLEEVETPVAVIELDKLDANLRRLQDYASAHDIALWPHTKTHKSPEIGLRQLELGAAGLTVAKSGEAQVFAEAGAPRILHHYPAFGAERGERLAAIAASGVDLTIAVDSVAGAESLSAALARHGATASVLVELDVGMHRTGQPTAAGALAVAQGVSRLPALRVAGISCYPGHVHGDEQAMRAQLQDVDALLREARDAFTAAGIDCSRISGGSTPSKYLTHTTCINEQRSGTYALHDRNDPAEPEAGGVEAAAIFIAVTVISDAVPGQVVIDCGSKTLSADGNPDGLRGHAIGVPGARVRDLNEEHGYVDVSAVEDRPRVGDQLRIIPNHACACVNLHDALLGVRNDVVERVIVVAGRGLIR
jgi:D-serine deaminase-like pyridoxal phosphate-dependent protein